MIEAIDCSHLLPQTNAVIFGQLFALEVGLRELIIEELANIDGSRWHKTLLPADVTQKYLRGRQIEKAAKWTSHVEHHPLYYIDFPDLAKILEKNWTQSFRALFNEKTVFIAHLKSLEPIRNKLAHNRKASSEDALTVSSVFSAFQVAVGETKLRRLIETCSVAPSIAAVLSNIKDEIQTASAAMSTLSHPTPLQVWPSVHNQWWFDSSFLSGTNHQAKLEVAESRLAELRKATVQAELEVEQIKSLSKENHESADTHQDPLQPVVEFFALYEAFLNQPRGRGTGHRVEAWVRRNNVVDVSLLAIKAVQTIEGINSHE